MIDNIFYGLKNGLVKLPKTVELNYIIESDISITSSDNDVTLNNTKIHNS